MKNKVLNLIKLLVVLLLFFQAGSLFVNLFNKVGIDLSLFDYKDSAYLDALVGIFLFIIIFLIYNKALFKDWNKFKEKLNENIKKVFAIFGILLGAKLIVGVF
ncbi:MAG: hypothetical protein PHF21_04985, partial [Bacilli bacterium]|nr:hypothetical protein [Bacilli bacterium]